MKNIIMVEYQNKTISLREVCAQLNLSFHTVYHRMKKGYPQNQWFEKKLPHNTPTGQRHGKFKHGKSNHKSRAYDIYHGMLQRCENPKVKSFACYGGRGIGVCKEWKGKLGFLTFLNDMGEPPSFNHSIERIDNDGNYSKQNCRWCLKAEQASNKRNSVKLTKDGQTFTATEWARKLGLGKDTIHRRLRKGWSIEECFSNKKKNQFG